MTEPDNWKMVRQFDDGTSLWLNKQDMLTAFCDVGGYPQDSDSVVKNLSQDLYELLYKEEA